MLALCPRGFPWVGTAVAAAVPQRSFGVGRTELMGFGFPESLSAHLATSGGSAVPQVSPWWQMGFVHSQVEVLLLGTCPCVWGHLSVSRGCLLILTSSSPPRAGGRGDTAHGSGSASSQISLLLSSEGGLQSIEFIILALAR